MTSNTKVRRIFLKDRVDLRKEVPELLKYFPTQLKTSIQIELIFGQSLALLDHMVESECLKRQELQDEGNPKIITMNLLKFIQIFEAGSWRLQC